MGNRLPVGLLSRIVLSEISMTLAERVNDAIELREDSPEGYSGKILRKESLEELFGRTLPVL